MTPGTTTRTGAFTFIILASALAARADVLHLANGGRIEGRVTVTADGYVLRTETGSVTFAKEEVREHVLSRTPLETLESDAAALRPDDADGRFRLASRARSLSLDATAERLFLEVLALDPKHDGAHLALGHVRKDDRWLEGDDALRAQGLVKVEGKWVTREQIDAILAERQAERLAAEADAARADAERVRAEAARADAERELAELRIDDLERRLRDLEDDDDVIYLTPFFRRRFPVVSGIRISPPAGRTSQNPTGDPYTAPPFVTEGR